MKLKQKKNKGLNVLDQYKLFFVFIGNYSQGTQIINSEEFEIKK